MAENAIEIQEKPILFSGAMVRAVIEGRKTQTRRVAKLACQLADKHQNVRMESGDGLFLLTREAMHSPKLRENFCFACPYGKPGDRLWVRETWRPWGFREDDPITVQFPDACIRRTTPKAADLGYEDWYERVAVQATEECIAAKCERDSAGNYCWDGFDNCPIKWRPSIHMPRWASRLTLEIVSVKVERVQEISEADAIAEGTPHTQNEKPVSWGGFRGWYPTARDGFRDLWNSINEKRGFGWEENPWVWAIEFKAVK